jgi:hypothetical protein
MSKSFKIILYTIIFVLTVLSLMSITLLKGNQQQHINTYEVMVTILPIVGGILGMMVARNYSSFKSSFGQGIIFVSLYLFIWGLGQAAWTYYVIFSKVEIPYPSLADIGYLLAIPPALYGVYKLSQAMGVKYALRTRVGKITLIVIPLLCIIASYYLLIIVGRGGFPSADSINIKFIVDLAYPTSDLAIIAFSLTTIVLTRKQLGGRFRVPLYAILLGFVLMYIADFGLSYTSNNNTYHSGCWVDYFWTVGIAVIAFGLIFLQPDRKKASQVPEITAPQPIQPINI